LHILITTALLVGAGWSTAAEPAAVDFAEDVQPILRRHCHRCHGLKNQEGGLQLNRRDSALSVADSDQPIVVPNDADASLLMHRIQDDAYGGVMPPDSDPLTAREIATLKAWIDQGARWPDALAEPKHWAYQPIVRPDTPEEVTTETAIDHYIARKLRARGLGLADSVDRPRLIRRASLALTGIPPTLQQVEAFVQDDSPDAYENVVDRLLESPRYGERWAIPWLDLARYADSNGFQQDGDTWQWIWRDWVVNALNADMPFDQFSIEQLAGDLLPEATDQQKIATAFNRNHLLNGEGGAIAEEQRFNNLFDRVDTTSTTWLGLTLACAQCHDHKYDPLTQADYYRLLHVFNQVPESGRPGRQSARIRVAPPLLELPSDSQQQKLADLKAEMQRLEQEARPAIDATYAAWKAGLFADGEPADGKDLPRNLTPLLRKPEAERTEADKKSIESQLRRFFDSTVKRSVTKDLPVVAEYDAAKKAHDDFSGDQIPRVMVMSDAGPRETRVLDRGDYLSPLGDPLS
ncbi:MAG: DUF1549 domain-containing protein, partial [Planctomycetia bacterium]|nr:DUF1549 domain-containing protein [Planctomycetia bacterium]